MSFWGATVITNLFSAIPVVGDSIVTWLLGGFGVGNPTLNRFYALHYLLPFVIVAVVLLHLVALHRFGSNNPDGIDAKQPQDTLPFHPYYTIKDMLGLAAFMMVFAWFVFYEPSALLNPDNSIRANPGVTPAEIVPEWYLLPYYAILKSIPNKLLGVAAMAGSILVLFLVPWLDTSPVRSARFRPLFKVFFWILVADCLLLVFAGGKPPEGTWLILSRAGAAYYFLQFLVVLPLVERCRSALANRFYEQTKAARSRANSQRAGASDDDDDNYSGGPDRRIGALLPAARLPRLWRPSCAGRPDGTRVGRRPQMAHQGANA
jgi:ubiquinol-cytochrome c reductase cytochrome b subunit